MPQDVLQDFGVDVQKELDIEEKEDNIKIDKKYREVYNIMSKVPIDTNEICKRTKKNIGEVNVILTMLELQGVIKQIGVNKFVRT